MVTRTGAEEAGTEETGADEEVGQASVAPAVLDPDSLPAGQRARRARIVRAAIELLEGGEYDRIQIRDVAERADVALATLYRYFSSKEHLYAAALVEWSADFRPRTRPGSEGETDEERLRALCRRAVRAFERWPQMLRAEIVIESSHDDNARALFARFGEQNRAAMAAAFRAQPTEHTAAVIDTVQSVLGSRLRSWALGRCTIADVDRAVQQTITLIYSPPPA